MRILVPHAYNVKGGVEKTAVSLIREFAELADRVIFVLPDSTMEYFKGMLPPSEKLVYESFTWPDDLITKVNKVIYKSRLEYLIKKHKVTHCLYPIINGQRVPDINIPVFGVLHDLYWRFLEHISDEDKSKREKELCEWAEKSSIVFTNSEATRKEAILRLPAYAGKFKAVPWAIDIPDVSPQDFIQQQGGNAVFYYPSAHFSRQKNHITLLKAAAVLAAKDLRFKIIISGEDIERMAGEEPFDKPWQEECRVFFHNNINVLSKHIELADFCPREKVESFYSEASCVVLPSTYEGFGLPLAEALARGVPVICSDLDVFREQVSLYGCADTVHFFPVGDINALAGRLREFINNPVRRVSSDRVRERFLHWTWENVAKKYVACFEKSA